jgi:6-pyruvoyltetrahydropterin/6-carboxytetrahydropterin synthase
VLRAAMQAMAARIRDRDLEAIRPPEAEAVTVEVLARWAHGELGAAVARSGAETLSVRVWETPADFGGYAGPLP